MYLLDDPVFGWEYILKEDRMPYDQSKTDLDAREHELAAAAYEVVEAILAELEDEDPDKIDFDDILTILTKMPGPVMKLVLAIKENPKDYKTLEAIGHGVARQLI
jgi:hypothetical protein